LILYSEQITTVTAINSLLGYQLQHIFNLNGNKVFSKELFQELYGRDATPSQRYMSFLLTIARDYDINRVNLKVFSNRDAMMDMAKHLGSILADRDGTVFDAVKVFANLHPKKLVNLYVRNSELKLSDLLRMKNLGYLSLAGEELSLNKKAPAKMRNIQNRHFIDNAA
jgi:hypothetical protein